MPHPSKCRAVVFDAVGTLLHVDPGVAPIYAEVGRRFGCAVPIEEIQLRFQAAFRRQEEVDRAANWRTSEDREIQRWRAIVRETLGELNNEEGCFAELYERFAQTRSWRCERGTAEVLKELQRRGIVLALASNFDRRLHDLVAGLPELAPIRHVLVSSEVGTRKPGRAFFEAVVKALGVPAAEIQFVGDDLINDWQGAQAAGMNAVLFDPRDRADVTPRVKFLDEMTNIL